MMPVIRSIGISDCSMSTTRIRDVTDINPPLLYKSCLRDHLYIGHRNKGRFTHLSFLPISYPTTLSPGFLHPMIPNSSPIAGSSSWEALTSRTRFCGESYIFMRVHIMRRRPRPRAKMRRSLVSGS